MKNINILFVNVNGLESNSFYGGPKGTIRNYECLKNCGKVVPYQVKTKSGKESVFSILRGYFPPISQKDYNTVIDIINKQGIDLVFFDQSFYGNLVRDVKKLGCKTVVFCHNCEKDYLNVRFTNSNKSVKKFIYSHLVNKNERIALENADIICTFLERDSRRLEACYPGIKVKYELPLAMEDKLSSVERVIHKENDSCLVFGPATSVNMIGVKWFVKNVSPRLNCKTVLAGKGLENYKELESEKVIVLGFVESLEDVYNKSNIVAIPQLEGAGMKVKTVEALMFGKYVVGTKEAFEGFDIDFEKVGALCSNADDFVESINKLLSNNIGFNNDSRQIYEDKYSVKSSLSIFKAIVKELS